MPNTQVTMSTQQVLDEVGQHKTACEQFALLFFSNLQAGLIQRDQRIAEFEAEFAALANERDTANAQRDAAQSALAEAELTSANRAAQIEDLQQQIVNLNAAIDAAQGQ